MRNVAWLLVLAAGLAFSGPAWAQRTLGPWAKPPAKLENRPIDLSQSVVPALPAPTSQPSSLIRFLPKMFRLGSPGSGNLAVSPLPAPSAFPSTSYTSGFKPIPDMPQKR